MTHKRRQVTTIHLPKEVNLSGIPRITRKKDEEAEKFQAVQEKSSAHVQKRAGTFLPFFVQKLFCFVQKKKRRGRFHHFLPTLPSHQRSASATALR